MILMWIYFSSAVLLLSASMARVWSDDAAARLALRQAKAMGAPVPVAAEKALAEPLTRTGPAP